MYVDGALIGEALRIVNHNWWKITATFCFPYPSHFYLAYTKTVSDITSQFCIASCNICRSQQDQSAGISNELCMKTNMCKEWFGTTNLRNRVKLQGLAYILLGFTYSVPPLWCLHINRLFSLEKLSQYLWGFHMGINTAVV